MNIISFFDQITDIFSTIGIFIVGSLLIIQTTKLFKTTKLRVFGLYVWHSIFSLVYAYVSLTMPSDTTIYYISSLNILPEFNLGTNAVIYLTSIFTNGLGFSYLGVFLIFNIFGTIGLLAVDASLRHATIDKSNFTKFLAFIIVLLPSMNFWTSAIGKDSIAYMSTGLLLWASIDLKNNTKLIAFSFICMFLVRPHISALIVIAFTLSLFITKILSPIKRIFLIIISLVGTMYLIPITIQYVGLEEITSIDLVKDFINVRQGYNLTGGGGIDISSMSLWLKLFTYSFRPLPYEAHSFLSFLSSIDNFILLIILVLSLISGINSRQKLIPLSSYKENRWFLIIFALSVMVISSFTTSNLGISVRQKWMYMPIILYFLFLYMKIKWSNPVKISKI